MKFIFSFEVALTRSPAGLLALLAGLLLSSATTSAQESYFVTYSQQMEEPGNLEIGSKSVTGSPKRGNAFVGSAMELEYGAKAWWTSELYLDGQSTANESTLFTGFRFENRFRPLLTEHWINPVLYAEFENINAADKVLLEVVGHDGKDDFLRRNDRQEKQREAELKLILSSNYKNWNISENLIAEKNLKAFPWEFGYALGMSRPLSLIARARSCVFCPENLSLGAEMYGGLGDRDSLGLHATSHYVAPLLEWRFLPGSATFKLSPGFGLSDNSIGFLFRFGIFYEIDQIASRLKGR